MDTLKDLLLFIKKKKKWWLLPVLIFLLLIGLLLISTSNTVIAPFIYTLFAMSYELDSHIQENTYGLDSFRKPVKQDHLTNPVGNYLFFDPHANCVVIPPVQPDRRGTR